MSTLTTLIPAYSARFLGPLFKCLQRQTWRDFRVIVADDSPGRRITEALRRGEFDAQATGLKVTVIAGAGSVLRNHQRALDAWDERTPFVHLLMDDDTIDADFYARHVAQHQAEPATAVSVSLRRLIDAQGRPIGALPLPEFIGASTASVVRVDAPMLVQSTVARCENWLGELSHMVLSARAARRFPRPPDEGVSWFGLPDIGTLLNAQDLGPIAVLRQTLGGFRQHGGQTTANPQSRSLKIAHLAWVAFALKAQEDGQLETDAARQAIAIAIRRCLALYAHDDEMLPFLALARDALRDMAVFKSGFAALWGRLLDANPDTRRTGLTAQELKPSASATPTSYEPAGVLILDDFFPNLLTGFRVAEYNALMQRCDRLRVLSCAENFETRHAEYAALYPQFAPRVQRFDPTRAPPTGSAVYCNFLFNATRFLPWIEHHRLPFAFTLYPGGGFGIGWQASDTNLRRVLGSPLLRHMVTTQPVTEAYLLDFAAQHGLVLPPRTMVAGSTANEIYFDAEAARHGAYFGAGKATLDVCFVAEQYMPGAENKGYPEFAAAAVALGDLPALRLHVVGPLTARDTSERLDRLGDRIRFHGRLETSKLQQLLTGMDIAISLSRPGLLHPGNFDGFPTCSSVEASLCGVAIVANDPLAQNTWYTDRESMILVDAEVSSVEQAVRWLAEDPTRIAALGRQGRAVTRAHYAPELQIGPRWAVLQTLMALAGAAPARHAA
jgi:glycosyltransferase involved in cell wall biosynthesis